MVVQKLPPPTGTQLESYTKIKTSGNIIEAVNYKKLKRDCSCIKLDKDHYILKKDLNTETGELVGEIQEYEHTENRFQGFKGLLESFARLRDLINCNVTNVDKVHWCTLTYAENMTDTKRLYFDYEKFWKRFLYYCKKNGYSIPKYITAAEPQERGAWHLHVLIIWERQAPFIPHDDLWRLWSPEGFEVKKDFIRIQSLYKDGKAIDNVGAYLTTYLTDTLTTDEHKRQKYERLKLYPVGFNVYRSSRGLKKPEIEYTTERLARKKVSSAKLTFEKRIRITDNDTGYENEIYYRYYNTKK